MEFQRFRLKQLRWRWWTCGRENALIYLFCLVSINSEKNTQFICHGNQPSVLEEQLSSLNTMELAALYLLPHWDISQFRHQSITNGLICTMSPPNYKNCNFVLKGNTSWNLIIILPFTSIHWKVLISLHYPPVLPLSGRQIQYVSLYSTASAVFKLIWNCSKILKNWTISKRQQAFNEWYA